jgi:hypothetical protein
MPSARPHPRRTLLLSVAVAVPVLVGAAIVVPLSASGAVDLPDLTAQELIEFAGASDVEALSGTIEQSSDLGLPDLGALMPSTGGGSSEAGGATLDDLMSLATGSYTAKVYLDGEQARLQVLDRLGERNVYVDGAAESVWFVDSESQTATQLVLPSEAERDALYGSLPKDPTDVTTPDDMLEQALARLDESTEVSVGTDSRVAGRDVYELILEPRTDDTLVGEVRFAIDGETGAAVAASITARGASDPAFELAFTQVDFSAPDASVFAFSPSADTTVVEKDVPLPTERPETPGEKPDAPTVYGEGWSTVVEMPSAPEGGNPIVGMDPEQLAMFEALTVAVDGGRVLQTSLVSVLITEDGRVLVGAVPADRLVAAAQTGR